MPAVVMLMEDSLCWPKVEARGGARLDARDPVERATGSIEHMRPYYQQAAIFRHSIVPKKSLKRVMG
jgi:hypothetical protein